MSTISVSANPRKLTTTKINEPAVESDVKHS